MTDPYAKTEYTSGTTYKQKTRHPEILRTSGKLTIVKLRFYFTKTYLADKAGTLTELLKDSPVSKSVPEPPPSPQISLCDGSSKCVDEHVATPLL